MEFTEYVKPELLVLIPVLYIIGAFIKSSLDSVANQHIPAILGVLGIILALLWVVGSTEMGTGSVRAFTAIVQGILCAGAAVYTHQLFKQLNQTDHKNGLIELSGSNRPIVDKQQIENDEQAE